MYNTLEDGTQTETEQQARALAQTLADDTGLEQKLYRDTTGGADYVTVFPRKEKQDV